MGISFEEWIEVDTACLTIPCIFHVANNEQKIT